MGDDQVRTECLRSLSAQEVALHGCSIQRSVQQIEHNLNLSKKNFGPNYKCNTKPITHINIQYIHDNSKLNSPYGIKPVSVLIFFYLRWEPCLFMYNMSYHCLHVDET